MYLSGAKTVTVCSLSYSWWEGPDVPDVIRPELPAGRSGPVRSFTDVACRTGPDVRSGPVPAGRVRHPVVPLLHLVQISGETRALCYIYNMYRLSESHGAPRRL